MFYSHICWQIEGAFVQGLGWVALEELKWGDADHKWIRRGSLYTSGPGTYKIPSVNDIPLKFKVSLLKVKTTNLFFRNETRNLQFFESNNCFSHAWVLDSINRILPLF